jgi:hypothetical protein
MEMTTYPPTERHIACLITGPHGKTFPDPEMSWPRRDLHWPELFLLVGLPVADTERWDLFGGKRQPGDLTGVQCVRHRLREQVGPALMPHVAGALGPAFIADGAAGPETVFPWLTFHVGHEPEPQPGVISRYARISKQTVGDFRWLADGGGAGLSRTERILQLALSLLEVPVYHQPVQAPVTSGLLTHEHVVRQCIADFAPSEDVRLWGPWLMRRTVQTFTIWEIMSAEPIYAARRK